MKIDEFGRNLKEFQDNLEVAKKYKDENKTSMEEKLGTSIEKMKQELVSDISKKLDEPPFIDVDSPPLDVLNDMRRIENKLKNCQ